ncbi:hypothetical protein WA026_017504 [Henosepilachna vigintioctopunctata]|uniref:Uncharacterized protein n=1 Tax=Henosepilachna vigintioctopunctata TaxID=420089 RepID=A0AAW1V3X5_9CUCU
MSTLQIKYGLLLVLIGFVRVTSGYLAKRSVTDDSVTRYLTERICVWNEVCKEEFQRHFKCKCPEHFFCRAPGRYYNAYCSMTGTGYIWDQPSFQAADV